MRRLYLRIYLAVLASLAVFVLATAVLWRQVGQHVPQAEIAATLALNVLPQADAQREQHQAALERLTANLHADLSVFSADRTLLASVGEPLPVPAREGWSGRWRGGPTWSVQLDDGRWLAARLYRHQRHPALGLLFTLALIALAVGVGAYPVVRRLTRRLERLQRGVESLAAGDLSVRVGVEGSDEVARLAESFNHAAARIEELVGAHKTLLANASHELRTPLARIRMALELPERRGELLQDIAELDALVDEILLASRLEAQEAISVENVDLLALAAEECARYEGVELEGEPVTMRGDARLLRRMIRNLLENARKHGRPPVKVTLGKRERKISLRICDSGPGVPPAEREKLFEPFYRGLGLSIVRQIARRHGGEARCEGSCFVISL
ncbi:MAG TPA: HAMP domain-containing sensor histidine kinase [Burkholderiales bacterium]